MDDVPLEGCGLIWRRLFTWLAYSICDNRHTLAPTQGAGRDAKIRQPCGLVCCYFGLVVSLVGRKGSANPHFSFWVGAAYLGNSFLFLWLATGEAHSFSLRLLDLLHPAQFFGHADFSVTADGDGHFDIDAQRLGYRRRAFGLHDSFIDRRF